MEYKRKNEETNKPRLIVAEEWCNFWNNFTFICGLNIVLSFSYRHKVTNTTKAKTSIIELDESNYKQKANDDEVAEREEKIRDAYLFRPGRLPPSRQVFYQYKSLTVPEAQILIQEYKLAPEQTCDEKNGWYKRGLEEKLRSVLAETIKFSCLDQDDNVSLATTNVTNAIEEESSEDDFEVESE